MVQSAAAIRSAEAARPVTSHYQAIPVRCNGGSRQPTTITNTATSLSSLSPTTTTYYRAVVKNGVCAEANSTAATVTVNQPAAVPTSMLVSASPVCSGTAVTLTANGGDNGSGALYEWGTGSTVGNNKMSPATTTAATRNVSPSTTTTYWVRRISNTTCTNTTGGVTNTVTVSQPATAPTSMLVSTSTICAGAGTQVTLTASGGDNGSGAYYQWGTGSTAGSNVSGTSTGNTRSVSPSTTTTYWVRRISNATCSNTTTGVTNTVTVNAASTISLTSASATQNQTVDEGNAITTTTYTLGGSATSYTISGLPSGLTHTMTSKAIRISGTPKTVGAYNYTITTTGPCTAVTITGSVKVEFKTGVCNTFNPGIIGTNEACTTFNAGTIGQ